MAKPESLKLTIPPNWEELDLVRAKVEVFLIKQGFKKDQIDAMVMTSSELTENAIKYGASGSDEHKVGISVDVYPEKSSLKSKTRSKMWMMRS